MSQKPFSFLVEHEYKSAWIIDSGSSYHLCNDINLFIEIKTNNKNTVTIANRKILESQDIGTIKLKTQNKDILLNDILYMLDKQ